MRLTESAVVMTCPCGATFAVQSANPAIVGHRQEAWLKAHAGHEGKAEEPQP